MKSFKQFLEKDMSEAEWFDNILPNLSPPPMPKIDPKYQIPDQEWDFANPHVIPDDVFDPLFDTPYQEYDPGEHQDQDDDGTPDNYDDDDDGDGIPDYHDKDHPAYDPDYDPDWLKNLFPWYPWDYPGDNP